MASDPTVLFPDLPPELRHEIYTYLSTPDPKAKPLNLQLPLQVKTFTCKHTTVQICPVHYGSTGLLALPRNRFLEADEYRSWLINNALELQVSVHFHGRIQTFIQAHWDKKMEVHLRKLGKLHPWLRKIPKYNIHMLWNPMDGPLRSKNNTRIAGHVPLDMAATLTQFLDLDVKRKQGCVQLGLHLDHKFATHNAVAPCKFGLGAFVADQDRLQGFRRLTKTVWKTPCTFTSLERALPTLPSSPLRLLPTATAQEKPLIVVEQGVVSWSARIRGQVVMHKTTNAVAGGVESVCKRRAGPMEFPLREMLAECRERM